MEPWSILILKLFGVLFWNLPEKRDKFSNLPRPGILRYKVVTVSFQYATFDYMLYFAGRLCNSSSPDSIFPYGGFLLDVNRGNLSLLVCCQSLQR